MGNLMKTASKDDEKVKELIRKHKKHLEELAHYKLQSFKIIADLEINDDKTLQHAGKVNEHEEIAVFHLENADSLKNVKKNMSELVETVIRISHDDSKPKDSIDRSIMHSRTANIVNLILEKLQELQRGTNYEEKDYSIFFAHNSLVKLLWFTYFYSADTFLLNKTESVIVSVIYFRVEVLDMIRSSTDVLLYEAYTHLGLDGGKKGLNDALNNVIEVEEKKRKVQLQLERLNEEDKNKKHKPLL